MGKTLTRPEQYRQFNRMVADLILYARFVKIPIRLGEAHRPKFVAEKYSKEKRGILRSKHRWSLAIDLWVTTKSGRGIVWDSRPYIPLGLFWKSLGGKWGGLKKDGGDFVRRNDPYHFEFWESPA